MEESLCSSVNYENRDRITSGCRTEVEMEGFVVASSASVELISQTSKCEPVMMEVQAETKG